MRISFCREMLRLIVRIVKITIDYVRGYWAIRHIEQPSVTILGGLRVKLDDVYGKQAFQLAQALSKHGFSIITGGGPGIMVSANCGATSICPDTKKDDCKTVGIGLTHINHGFENPCAPVFKANYFFIRKWFLFQYSVGFVFFPGGIGTVDELFELLNLVLFKMATPQFVILVDKDYWNPLLEWYVKTAMKGDLITLPPHEAFLMVDSPEEALHAFSNPALKNPTLEV